MHIKLLTTLLLLQLTTLRDTTPIIGVLMLSPDKSFPRHSAFAATSYIKWIEQSGFRWMPISMHESAGNILDKLSLVNGVLLTGGKLNLTKNSLNVRIYRRVVKAILDYAMEANDKGQHFPVLGVCLGYEAILSTIMGPEYRFIKARDMNKMRPIYFTKDAMESSHLLRVFSKKQLQKMSGKKLFYFHHKHAADLSSSITNPKFAENFSVLAAMNSTDHKQIITMVQHKRYPFIGMQFHPEKIQFEHFDRSATNRNIACVVANQKISLMLRFIVGEKEKNVLTTSDLATHKYRLYYEAEYKNYDEIVVMLPNEYKPTFQKFGFGLEAYGA